MCFGQIHKEIKSSNLSNLGLNVWFLFFLTTKSKNRYTPPLYSITYFLSIVKSNVRKKWIAILPKS